jgi:hypothetical protein
MKEVERLSGLEVEEREKALTQNPLNRSTAQPLNQ